MHCEHVTGWGDDEGCSVDACDKGGRNEKQLERWRTESKILVFNRFCPVIQENCSHHLGEGQYDTCRYAMIDTAAIRICPLEDQEEKKRLTELRRKTGGVKSWDYDSDRKEIEE